MVSGPMLRDEEILNRLEPEALVQAFVSEPPEGFEPLTLDVGGMGRIHGFIVNFDLLTTLDKKAKNRFDRCRRFMPDFILKLLRPPALFLGSPVSEYALIPSG